MAHFLVLTQVFPPDAVSTARIMSGLCEDVAAAGHRVTVLTTTPHYNPSPAGESGTVLQRSWIPILRKSRQGGVEVWHVVMPKRARSPVARVLAWTWYHAVSTIVAMGLPRANAILACSPPLTIGVSSWVIGLVHRAPFIYNVQELYPDIAVRLGVIRPGVLLRLLYGLESFVYRHAARVTTISPGMRRRLMEKAVSSEKALLVPNYVDVDAMRPLQKDNPFSRDHDLVDKFVVSYAGNLGLAQGIDTVLDAAARLRGEAGICFLITGEGLLRGTLERRVRQEGLSNVLFLPYQPFERMSEVYSASELNLVPLAVGAGGDALPSKIYRILACGRPILAVADDDSDLAAFARESGCGLVVPPGNAAKLAEVVRAVAQDGAALAADVRRRSASVVAAYSRPAVTARYCRLLEQVAAERAS